MLKRALRTVIRGVWHWLHEARQGQRRPSGSLPREFSYHWLNRTVFPRLLADGGRTLRPQYTWGVMQGAYLAKALGVDRISVLEFGVAGGNGLLALEQAAALLESRAGVAIEVYGFDTGVGLPPPHDYRDLPNLYTAGRHAMDVDKLRPRLQRAQLFLGLIEQTVGAFLDTGPAPVAFIAIDVDLYSSTRDALQLLEAPHRLLLPRIHCYCDDILGLTCGDHNGERLAIAEFTAAHPLRKISPIYGLKYFVPAPYAQQRWVDQYFMVHLCDHPAYGQDDGLALLSNLRLAD